MIRFPADIGASRRGTLHGCNEMRIAQLGHNETSRSSLHCGKKSGTNEEPSRYRQAERPLKKSSEINRETVLGNVLEPHT